MCFPRGAFAACVLLIVANILYIIVNVKRRFPTDHISSYTYQGHDFPENLPLSIVSSIPKVSVNIQDSASYPVAGLKSDDKWLSLTSSSVGYVRLGDENRLFMVTMFHELHCLRVLNLAFEPTGYAETPGPIDEGHIKHCFDYLRQMILCSADRTLEDGDFVEQQLAGKKVVHTHICRDWKLVYQEMEGNWERWINKTT